jgi:hypothetical protein
MSGEDRDHHGNVSGSKARARHSGGRCRNSARRLCLIQPGIRWVVDHGGDHHQGDQHDGNQTKFAVAVSGGTGPCTGGVWITFPASAAPDLEAHKRAYSAALVALTTAMKVTNYNYNDNNCAGASYIEVSR